MANITQIVVPLKRVNSGKSTIVTFSLYDGTDPNSDLGNLLWSDTYNTSGLAADSTFHDVTFSGLDINATTCILIMSPGAEDSPYADIYSGGYVFLQTSWRGAATDGYAFWNDTAGYDTWSDTDVAYNKPFLVTLTTDLGTEESCGTGYNSSTMMHGDYVPSPPTVVSSLYNRRAVVFELNPSVPEKATTPSPEDEITGVVNNDDTLKLTWVDGGAGEPNAATSYDVYFGTLSLSKVAEGVEDTEYLIGSINELTEFQWRIDSINDAGTTTGDVWTFTTSGIRGLGAPINPTPETEATNESVHLASLSYENGGGASAYRLYARPSGGTYQLIDEIDSSGVSWGTSDTVPLAFYGLDESTTYEWYVTATNGSFGLLDSIDGPTWEFTTRAFTGDGGDNYYPVRDSLELNKRLVVAANHKLWYES